MARPSPELVLRPWVRADAPSLLAAYGGADMERQRPAELGTIEDAERIVDGWAEDAAAGRAHVLAVECGGVVAGQVAVTSLDRHDTGWVSYWTVVEHRGRGVATQGLRLLATHCFDVLGLHRLELGHRTDNPASCRVALAAGFAVEGLERERLRYGDRRFDVERHARLATDPD